MATLDRILRGYLSKFQETFQNATAHGTLDVELQCRPVVHDVLTKLVSYIAADCVDAVVRHEAPISGTRHKPDWTIEDPKTFGVFCYADHKALAPDGPFNLTAEAREQMQRYLKMDRPLFVFDGIEFIFYHRTLDNPSRYCIIEKPVASETKWAACETSSEFVRPLYELLHKPGYRKWSEVDLVSTLSARARLVSDSICSFLDRPRGSGEAIADNRLIDALHDLKGVIEEHHDPALRDQSCCADFIAQVLVFGLFFAHTQVMSTEGEPEQRRAAIKEYWKSEALGPANRLEPFSVIFESLESELSTTNELGAWYRDLAGVFAHAQYMGSSPGPTDFHALYERFLEAFDNEQRFDRGVFYTDPVLAEWTVRMVDVLVQRHFGGRMAAAADRIIDPCCGTGGFLEAVVRHLGDCDDEPPELIGFEILPAPYALAHYRLRSAVSGTQFENRIEVFLTDTLSDRLMSPPAHTAHAFAGELARAAHRATPPLRIVLGNPPSSIRVASEAPRLKITAMMNDLRPPASMRAGRSNRGQAINNESYRFLRWCAERVIESGHGVLALVLPEPFARSISFASARKWLLDRFQDIWILKFDHDARAGGDGDSLFRVRQGRTVLLAVLNPDWGGFAVGRRTEDIPHNENVSDVKFLDISRRTRKQKIQFLKEDVSLDRFSVVSPRSPQFLFTPVNDYPELLWQKCWPLHRSSAEQGIFKSSCSGVKLAPTALLFHTDPLQLVARSSAIARSQRHGLSALVDQWFNGQQKPPRLCKLTSEVRTALGEAVTEPENNISRYSYRPFVDGFAIVDDGVFEALKSTPGNGTRPRPELRTAFERGAAGMALTPATVDVDDGLFRFVTFAWNLPDNDLVSRGSSRVYCDIYPEVATDPDTMSSNMTEDISILFGGVDHEHRAALYYVYAVMNCDAYLDTFEGALYRESDTATPPRVPIFADADLRRKIADMGRMIALCECVDFDVAEASNVRIEWPENTDEIVLTRFVRESSSPAGDALTLIGENSQRIRVTGIPDGVLGLRVGGYNVVDQWIRERKVNYFRRTFRQEDAAGLREVINRIAYQLSLLKEADDIVRPVLEEGEGVLQGPATVG